MKTGWFVSSLAFAVVLFALTGRPLMAEPLSSAGPQRVVSLSLCADQFVLALTPRERIKGLSVLANSERYSPFAAEAQGLVRHRATAEEVMALDPDLVVAGGYTRRQTVDMLTRLGVPLLSLPPAELGDVPDLIAQVAAAVGNPEGGARLAAAFTSALTRARDRGMVGALYRPGGDLPGPKTVENEVIERAGLTSLAASLGLQAYARVTIEELVVHRPDVLIVDSRHDAGPSLGRQILFHPALRQMSAVHGMADVEMPIRYWLCASPRSTAAISLLTDKLDRLDGQGGRVQ